MRQKNKKFIRLEPASIYDKAIVKESDDGELTYSYRRLVKCVLEEGGDMSYEDAAEYTDYNIVGLAVNGFKVSYNRRYDR